MKPPVSEPSSKPHTEAAFQTLNSRVQEELRIRQEMEYAKLEEGSLEIAIKLARNNPGFEREVWGWMSTPLDMMNTTLRARGLPLINYPSFQRFMRLLRTNI